MKRFALLLIVLYLSSLLTRSANADSAKNKNLAGIEVLTGFSEGDLKGKENYILTPLLLDLDFDLKPLLLQKLNFNPRPLVQFQIEPFISFVSTPNNNIETGTSFFLKVGILPETSKFQPYVKGGVGMVYMTQHTREQSTQFNFTEQAGIGMQYFFFKNTAFILEGRLRHLSNAKIKEPNIGIDNYFILAGISHRF